MLNHSDRLIWVEMYLARLEGGLRVLNPIKASIKVEVCAEENDDSIKQWEAALVSKILFIFLIYLSSTCVDNSVEKTHSSSIF